MTREWDARVIWLESRQLWWWNAWHQPTETEMYGRADSHEQAQREMTVAMTNFRGRAPTPLPGFAPTHY